MVPTITWSGMCMVSVSSPSASARALATVVLRYSSRRSSAAWVGRSMPFLRVALALGTASVLAMVACLGAAVPEG